MDAMGGVDPWAAQACGVIPCAEGAGDCLAYPRAALREGPGEFGAFASLELRAELSPEAEVFPVALAWPERLLSPSLARFERPEAPPGGAWRLGVPRLEAEAELVSLELGKGAGVTGHPCL